MNELENQLQDEMEKFFNLELTEDELLNIMVLLKTTTESFERLGNSNNLPPMSNADKEILDSYPVLLNKLEKVYSGG